MNKAEVCFLILVGIPLVSISTYFVIHILSECLMTIKDLIDYWKN